MPGSNSSDDEYYLLEMRKVPVRLWTVTSNAADWFKDCPTAGKNGFPANSLGTLPQCASWIQIERFILYPLYFWASNILPFGIPLTPLLRFFTPYPKLQHFAYLVLAQVVLMQIQTKYWRMLLRRFTDEGREKQKLLPCPLEMRESQKLMYEHLDQSFEMERQNHHYFGTRWILPKSIVNQLNALPPCIIAMTPHGVVPFGASGAAAKIFGGRMSRWAGAPILFKVWGTQKFLKRLGIYPAGKAGILKCLAGGDNAALVLDGIPGMFCKGSKGNEKLWLLQRKAICAIALQAGSPIVPGYCFGTNDACTIVDPLFGLCRWASTKLDMSLTPFFGRFWIPFGVPARRPMLMCFGDPIPCEKLPEGLDKSAISAAVDAKHAELLDAYRAIFDTHKAAYGRPNAKLEFV